MSIYDHFRNHFSRLHEIFCDLVKAEHDQSEQLAAIRRETFALHKENLEEARQVKIELEALRFLVGEIRVAMPLLREIHTAVVPKPVAQIKLSNETGEAMSDIKVGQNSNLSAQFLDADGNPTVPNTPVWQATDPTDFSLTVAADSQTASLGASGTVGATDDVSVVVTNADGSVVTSNVLSYTLAQSGPPPAKPVASIILTATDPA